MPAVTPMGPREWALLFTLSLLWGGSFLFAGLAVRDLGPLTVALGRVSLAALVLLLVLRLRGIALDAGLRDWRDYAVMALLNNVIPFSLIFWALQHVELGLAAILNAATPFFTVLLAQALTADEKITPGKVAGVLIGLAGVALLVGVHAVTGVTQDLIPSLACTAGALSYAGASVWARRFRTRASILPATGQLVASTVILLPVVVLVEAPWRGAMPGPAALASLAALAVFSTALGYLIYFRILRTAGATNLTLVTLLIPATASVLGWLVMDETLPPEAFAGMALIGVGIAAMDGRPWAMLRRRLGRPAHA